MLALLSVGLLTGYFREGSGGGGLHGIQSAVSDVVGPAQETLDTAVQPVRDAWQWTTSLIDARDRAAQLEEANRQLQKQAIELRNQEGLVAELRKLLKIQASLPDGYGRLNAEVTAKSVGDWYRRIRVDVGSDAGVIVNAPVVAPSSGDGPEVAVLVGIVVQVSASTADVALVTDRQTRVGASVQRGSAIGILEAADNGQLALRQVPREFLVRRGDVVLTAGFDDLARPSLYPRGLAIGRVRSVGSQLADTYQQVQVSPLVDVRELEDVVVLTPKSDAAKRRARG